MEYISTALTRNKHRLQQGVDRSLWSIIFDRRRREQSLRISSFAFPPDKRSFSLGVHRQVIGIREEIVLSMIAITLLPMIRGKRSCKWMTFV